jgi:hypothetical protein
MPDIDAAGDNESQPRYTPGDHFEGGFSAARDHGPGLTPSLLANSARQNQAAPHQYTPQSTLAQIGLSPMAQNASAPDMSGRYNEFTGSVLPNVSTGSSEATAATAMKLRFMGDQNEA